MAAQSSQIIRYLIETDLLKQLEIKIHQIDSLLLVVQILEEQLNKTSKWVDYLALLPKDWSNFPLFYTDEEMALLHDSEFMIDSIAKEKSIQRETYNFLADNVPDFA